jgi:hypothetical protein
MKPAGRTRERWCAITFALTLSSESSMPCGSGMSGCKTSLPVVRRQMSFAYTELAEGIHSHRTTVRAKRRSGMDGLSDLIFRGFRGVTQSIGSAIFQKVATCVVFAGYCGSQQRIRAFRMEVDEANNHSIREVLLACGISFQRAHACALESFFTVWLPAPLMASVSVENPEQATSITRSPRARICRAITACRSSII